LSKTWFQIQESHGKFLVTSHVRKFSAFEGTEVTFENFVGEFDSAEAADKAVKAVQKAMYL
jgi:hypothetical protein